MVSSIGPLSKLFSHSPDSLRWIQWFIVNRLGINIQLGDTKLWCLNTNYCQSISIAHIKCHLDYSLHRAVWKPGLLLGKRKEGHYAICWKFQRYGSERLVFTSDSLLQLNEPCQSWTERRHSVPDFAGHLSLPCLEVHKVNWIWMSELFCWTDMHFISFKI